MSGTHQTSTKINRDLCKSKHESLSRLPQILLGFVIAVCLWPTTTDLQIQNLLVREIFQENVVQRLPSACFR